MKIDKKFRRTNVNALISWVEIREKVRVNLYGGGRRSRCDPLNIVDRMDMAH